MLVDDPVLPAAAHLTGAPSRRVLSAAVVAAGGELVRARPCHVQYRAGRDVVVRFEASVRWNGGPAVPETLMASTAIHGPPDGTLPVEAVTPEDVRLAVGVWRWPFDPHVTGLTDAVTPAPATRFLEGIASGRVRLEVLTFRPTLRAVVRAVDEAGSVFYVKAVRPGQVAAVVERHERLLAAGVPVPSILRSDAQRGLIAMEALAGPTIRDRIARGHALLPDAGEYEHVYAALSAAELPAARRVDGRAATALGHAAMLATVVPGERSRLDRLTTVLASAAERARARTGPVVHGDLYEAQLVTGRGRGQTAKIVGVLDLDDAGPGDPLDDRATVIAHLLSRAIDSRGNTRSRLAEYARALRHSFADHLDDHEDLDLVTAGALVGLATNPFRTQRQRWPQAVRHRLTMASRLIERAGEKNLRISS